MVKTRKVTCPRCANITDYSLENKWRPFCSERCRTIDLGNWGNERYRMPAEDAKPDEEEKS